MEAVRDFGRSCLRVITAERFSLSRLLKFPFRSYFQREQGFAAVSSAVALNTP
jgi:hypothetical protein